MSSKSQRSESTSESSGSATADDGLTHAQDLLGNDYMVRLMEAGLTEQEIADSTLLVTQNASRYLLNDDDVRLRVGDEGWIRATHTETWQANDESIEAHKEAIGDLTEAIKDVRQYLKDNPDDAEAQDALDVLIEERKQERKERNKDQCQKAWHKALAIVNAIGGNPGH